MRSAIVIFEILIIVFAGGACHATSPQESSANFCQENSDCVVAIDVKDCCSCPQVVSQSQRQSTKGLEVYVPGNNYGKLRPPICASVDCSGCPLPPAGAVCKAGKCQAPDTVDDILSVCADCYSQAAQAAYKAGNYSQAVDFCSKPNPNEQYVCFSQIFRSALEKNRLTEAEGLCRQFLDEDIGSCIRPLALRWVNQDDQYAVRLCNEMDPDDARHFGCLLDLALAVRTHDFERAVRICGQLKADEAEMCLQDIARK